MKAGSLIWDEKDGYGNIGRSLHKWAETQEPITVLDAIQDWIAELEQEYKHQYERLMERAGVDPEHFPGLGEHSAKTARLMREEGQDDEWINFNFKLGSNQQTGKA